MYVPVPSEIHLPVGQSRIDMYVSQPKTAAKSAKPKYFAIRICFYTRPNLLVLFPRTVDHFFGARKSKLIAKVWISVMSPRFIARSPEFADAHRRT